MTEKEQEEKEKPLTREDVLRLIEENGGTAEGLDLSGKEFETSIDLRGLNLSGLIANGADLSGSYPPPEFDNTGFWIDDSPETKGAHLEGVDLYKSNLREAMLSNVHFEHSILTNAELDKAILWGAHLEEADLIYTSLKEADLQYAYLQKARLQGANLQGSNLSDTKLQLSQLFDANLKGATLYGAHLEGADLSDTELAGAYLYGAQFDNSTRLHDVNWGNYLIGEEIDGYFDTALDTYRRLKNWYTNAGMYDVAGEFFFSEMTAKRKAMEWWPKPWNRAWSKFLSLICGYGERPLRVVGWAASVLLIFTFIYLAAGSVLGWNFWNSLYFSAVSFTALGYGSWLQLTNDWIRGFGAFESFIGVFSMALFLITFIRKMTR